MSKTIKMPKITKNKKTSNARALVYQGNPLIQSRKYFDTIGTRLFTLGLMTLNPHLSNKDKFFDEEFPDIHISTSELTKLFGDSKYLSMLETECEKIFNSSIKLKYDDKSFELMHIFDVMKYKANDGLYIKFDSKMKEYLLELVQGGYTAINIEQIFKLTSTYAVRLIELCMQYRNMTEGKLIERRLSFEELKFYLNVPDDAYVGRIDHFKQFVLEEPIKEIEKITDFRMSYKTEKEGRRIKYFILKLDISGISEEKFDVKFEYGKKLPIPAPYADVLAELTRQGFSNQAAKDILSEVRDNVEVGLRLEYALKILLGYAKKRPVKNVQGFLRKAILENWRKNDVKSKNQMNISEKSKIKNQLKLNNLSIEKEMKERLIEDAKMAMEQTGISEKDLQGKEKPMTKFAVGVVKEAILKGGGLPENVQMILNAFKFSVERFKEVYMKNCDRKAEGGLKAKFGANKAGFTPLSEIVSNIL